MFFTKALQVMPHISFPGLPSKQIQHAQNRSQTIGRMRSPGGLAPESAAALSTMLEGGMVALATLDSARMHSLASLVLAAPLDVESIAQLPAIRCL